MAYDSWYCGLPSFVSDKIASCVPTAADQLTIMRGNFGPAMPPAAVDQAVNDFSTYLSTSGYDASIATAKCQDSPLSCSLTDLFTYHPWLLMIGGVVVVALIIPMASDGGPRRYGR